jgi:hypothetical protein
MNEVFESCLRCTCDDFGEGACPVHAPVCPTCGGMGASFGFWDGTDEKGEHVGGCGPVVCLTCEGRGHVGQEVLDRIVEGKRRRRERIDRGLSLRDEATRLGISMQELCNLEHGRTRS